MIILGPVAVAKNRVIGGDNDLPWNFPDDLKHFKKITTGKTVLMGRKTYDSIFKRLGKPLPNRKNIVVTRNYKPEDYPTGVLVFKSPEEAIEAMKSEDIYIIGGAQMYAQFLNKADKMYMTHVHGEYPGDAFFPEVDFENDWTKIEEEPHEEYTYATYIRNK